MSGGVERATQRLSSRSVEETRTVGRELARRLRGHETLLLYGDLGSGKTVLTQGLGEGLGLDPNEIHSPSYTLIHEHETGRCRLTHIDLYRLEPADLPALGLEELLQGDGLKVVEWAERIDFPVIAAWHVRIRREPDGSRTIEIEKMEPNEN